MTMAKAMVVKMTRTPKEQTDRLIEAIKAKTDVNHRLWKMYEGMGDANWARYYKGAYLELDSVLLMLTHPDFLEKVCAIYKVGGEVA